MSVLPRARLLTLSLAASLALTACGEEPRPGPAAGPEGELTELPGVASAELAEVLVEQDTPGTAAVVDVESDISADELGAVLARIEELALDEWTVTLDCGSADQDDDTRRQGCDTATGTDTARDVGDPGAGARALLTAARRFPAATVTVRSHKALTIDLDDAGHEPVGRALATVLADAGLGAIDDLTIGAGPRTGSPRFVVSTRKPVDPSALTLWRRLAPSLDLLPAGIPGAVTLAVDEEGTVAVSAQVRLPGVVLPEGMTPGRHGAALWPALRAQLDIVAGLPDGTQYAARNAYRPVAGARPHGNDPFLSVTLGRRARPDQLGRTWSVDAARYLASR